ncbi:hypothetical protein Tco_0509559 [Tanacetum coccineum]
MRSSSSSSSRSRYKRYTKEEILTRTHCDYPLLVEMQVAWTITNPGRRFKGCSIFDEDEKCHFYGFFDDELVRIRIFSSTPSGIPLRCCDFGGVTELPSDYYKKKFNLHEENEMLKKNLGKNMYKNKKKSNISDEGFILEMGELQEDLTLIKSKLQMYDKVVVISEIQFVFNPNCEDLSLSCQFLGDPLQAFFKDSFTPFS